VCSDAFDTEGIANCLELLKKGKAVDIPIYDFVTHQRSTEVRKVSFSLSRSGEC
jgi:uridine kinase